MTVLHIIDTLDVGGAERLLTATIRAMSSATHHVIALTDRTPLQSELPPGCLLTKLQFKGKIDAITTVRRIRKYIRTHNIDIVHSHLVLSNILARLATPANIPLLNSIHNINGPRFYQGFLSPARWIEKLTYRKRHTLIAVSETVLNDYRKYIGVKGEAIVLYNFVEDRFFAAAPKKYVSNNQLKLIAVGSLKKQKNYEFLINAFRELPLNITLDIYGDGPLRENLVNMAAGNTAIRFCGNHSSIEKVLLQYDLFVMSSLYEGHPIALMEAAAAGLPILVTDIPVLVEALGEKGLYFKRGNEKDFQRIVTAILSGDIELNTYAKDNWELASKVARQELYIRSLYNIYDRKIRKSFS